MNKLVSAFLASLVLFATAALLFNFLNVEADKLDDIELRSPNYQITMDYRSRPWELQIIDSYNSHYFGRVSIYNITIAVRTDVGDGSMIKLVGRKTYTDLECSQVIFIVGSEAKKIALESMVLDIIKRYELADKKKG
jgi:hypothetical protein